MEASTTTEPFRFSADAAADLRSADPPDERRGAEHLVRETKREIRRLVQDIATLCHSRIPPRQFWPRFLSDVGTSMAADGGIVWQRRDGDWIRVAHNGALDRRLLQTVGAESRTCHDLMIREVGHNGGPVIVPPGAAWNTDIGDSSEPPDQRPVAEHPLEPGNPTESLAAVVPIPVDPDEPVEWMMELFLPVGGGPATQRGYLRFAAQMADLAADFLRRERLREARARADEASRMHDAIVTLYRSEDRAAAEQRIVDAAAKLFAADRVSLVCRRNRQWTVVAVSGVDHIDPALPAVRMIREMAAEVSGAVGFIPAVDDPRPPLSPSADPPANSDASSDSHGDAHDGRLTLRGVGIVESHGDTRLVVEDRSVVQTDPHQQQRWSLFIAHTEILLGQLARRQRAGLLGWIRPSRRGGRMRVRRTLLGAAVAVGLVLLCGLPVPMVVTAEARLEPRQVQMLYAPRDSVVAEIWVEHGDHVQLGDSLLRLTDPQLERSIHALLGRRAVLNEQSAELRTQLVSGVANDSDEAERLQTEQRITTEELRSIAAELEVLTEERERLILRSDRSGIVDAWQIRERLANRPVRRGQSLFRVVAPEGGWLIEADVPQNRIDHIIAAEAKGPTRAEIVLHAFPDLAIAGRLEQIGPAARATAGSPSAGGPPTGTVMFSLDPSELPLLQPGAPAQIGIDCGHRPLGYVACQDLVRTIVGTLRLYW